MYKRVFPTFPFRFCFSSPAATVLHTSHLPLFKQPPFKQPKQPKQQFQRLDPIFSRSYSKTRPSATMINASLPVATQASSEVLSRAASSHDSTFKILYFGLHGRGELSRNLLAYGDAKWEELAVDWGNQKTKTQFQCLPVVYETAADGTILELSESQAIERYLAKKFQLMGKNAWEEHKVNEFFNSTDSAMVMFGLKVANGPVETRLEEANKFYAETLSKFITLHEAHLAKNGSNGHYVGNHTTLADIKTATFMDRLLLLQPKGANEVGLSKEKTPNLWKVRETVNAHPSMKKWQESARYKELNASTRTMFKFD